MSLSTLLAGLDRRLARLPLAALLVPVALGGASLLMVAMRWGIGVSHDSIQYISQADVLALGEPGPHTALIDWLPPTHYPPLYPQTLALLMSMFGVSAPTAALALNAALLFGVMWLGGYMAWCATESRLAALTGTVLVGLAGPTLGSFVHAWSEPGFLLLCLLAWYATARHIYEAHFKFFLLLLFVMMLLPLQRYAGVAVVGSSLLSLLIWMRGAFHMRVLVYGVMGAVALLPTLIWGLSQPKAGEGYTFRKVAWMGLRDEHRNGLAETFYSWTFPGKPGFWVMILAVLVVVTLLVLWGRYNLRHFRLGDPGDLRYKPIGMLPLPSVLTVFLVVYIAFLAVSISFMDNATPFDNRILLPAYAAWGFLLLIAAFKPVGAPKALAIPLIILFILTLGTQLYQAQNTLRTAWNTGFGFASTHYQNGPMTPVLQRMAQAPAGTLFFAEGSSGYDMFYLQFISGKKIYGYGSLVDLPMLRQNAPDTAYIVFLNGCCPNGENPQVPNYQGELSPVIPSYYYRIADLPNAADSAHK